MAQLHDLPREVLKRIADFTAPGDVVNFALTCKDLLYCSKDSLALHQQRVQQYALVQDIDPFEVPRLMKEIITDENVAWYIRKMIFWERRIRLEEWKKPMFLNGTPEGSLNDDDEDFDEGAQASDYEFPPGEIPDDLLNFWQRSDLESVHRLLESFCHLSATRASQWVKDVENGSQEVLKCLISAICPKLLTLVVVQDGADFGSENMNCIVNFTEVIKHKANTDSTQADVFSALKHVYLQQPSYRRHPHDQFLLNESDVVPFMSLPNIETISMHCAGYADDFESDDYNENCTWRHMQRTSNVQSLSFSACDFSTEAILRIVKAARSLKYLWADGGAEFQGVEDVLQGTSANSLEILDIWDFGVQGYTLAPLDGFKVLKHVAVSGANLATWLSNPRRKSPDDRLLHPFDDNDEEGLSDDGEEQDEDAEVETLRLEGHENEEDDVGGQNEFNDDNDSTWEGENSGYEPDHMDEAEDPYDGKYGITGWVDLRTHLPASIETFRIGRHPILRPHFDGFMQMVRDFVDAKPSSFPSLRGICLRNVFTQKQTVDDLSMSNIYLTTEIPICQPLQKRAQESGIEIAFSPGERGPHTTSDPGCGVCPVQENILGE